jgi:hypothetical protein
MWKRGNKTFEKKTEFSFLNCLYINFNITYKYKNNVLKYVRECIHRVQEHFPGKNENDLKSKKPEMRAEMGNKT